jgi:hypothetical protein
VSVVTNANSNLGLNLLVSSLTNEVTFSPTFQPGFFAIVSRFIRLLISGEPDHLQRIDKITVRSVSDTLSLTNNYVQRISVLWTTAVQRDSLTVALGVHVVVVHTRTTPVNDKATPSRLLKTR